MSFSATMSTFLFAFRDIVFLAFSLDAFTFIFEPLCSVIEPLSAFIVEAWCLVVLALEKPLPDEAFSLVTILFAFSWISPLVVISAMFPFVAFMLAPLFKMFLSAFTTTSPLVDTIELCEPTCVRLILYLSPPWSLLVAVIVLVLVSFVTLPLVDSTKTAPPDIVEPDRKSVV